ncbi:hypothetical protein BC833DRAFT_621327 [Globomyces pollinis-pini]|nr:hypothetical protein BC833DRAFT_621327 [Globomyces pollinis-pini]
MTSFTFSSLQSVVPFLNLFIGTTAMSMNLVQAQKLKKDLHKLERKHLETSQRYKQLESEKIQLAQYSEPRHGFWSGIL